jgi:hypothetical protein
MKTARHVYRVETRKVKIVFIVIAVSFPVVLLIALLVCVIVCPRPDGVIEVSSKSLKVKDFLVLSLFPMCLLAFLWVYGKWRMFGFEWHLHDDGLRIYKNHREIRYIPWENIAKINRDYIIKDASDGKKFIITLPPPVRRDMLRKMQEIMDEKAGRPKE